MILQWDRENWLFLLQNYDNALNHENSLQWERALDPSSLSSLGSGKTVLINDKLVNLPDEYMVANVPFNFYTTSDMLQRVLEKPLEKKAG